MSDHDEIPLLWDTTDAPSAFDPADWFAYCEEITGRPTPQLPPLAVQTVSESHFELALDRYGAEADDFTLAGHPFARIVHDGVEMVVGLSAKGSYAAGGLDELIAMGVRHAVFVGGCATLVHEIAVDDLVLATRALRDEGVSLHYEPPSRWAYPSEALTRAVAEAARARGVTVHEAPVWTTTAHFRQALPRLRAFREEGCRAVNNEASQAFSVGRHRGVDVAALLMAGDTLADDRFRVPTGHAKLYGREQAAPQLELALDALARFARG